MKGILLAVPISSGDTAGNINWSRWQELALEIAKTERKTTYLLPEVVPGVTSATAAPLSNIWSAPDARFRVHQP